MKKVLVNQLIYRFMRIGLLPLLLITGFAGMMYARPLNGQEILNRKINLVANQKEIRTVLTDIGKLADIKFVYSAQRIPARQKVSLVANNRRLGDILDDILQPLNILYYVTGSQIVLTRKGDAYNLAFLIKDQVPLPIEMSSTAIVKPVNGKVTNENGEPLFGVSVLVRGTSRGTTTNESGEFSINAEVGETLEFSMVGYKIAAMRIGESSNVSIQLLAETANMNEVIIVGYGTQRRSSLTGAIASLTNKTITQLPVPSVEQALQGRVAGITVTNNGEPGMSPIVRVRGVSSINFASDPCT